MDTALYLEIFKKSAAQLDKAILDKKQLDVAAVLYEDSVCLKIYKKSWANKTPNPLTAESRIFFSAWVHDATLKEQKLLYNIHALKLRQLKGYRIESRKFANIFRESFKKFEAAWQNVSTDFGPLTLMQGWVKTDLEKIEGDVIRLCNSFIDIEHLIDDTLANFRHG